ncbi:MAG: DUF2142 domain-containing protein [Anaerolineae bacterium]|nr:DUF2142 domain-containing protein [Anaerolineae bacterium]
MPRTERILLILLIAVYLVVGVLFAARTAAWQAPDEPAHYNYVAQVATNGCCPVLEIGDWDSAYLDELKSARFPTDMLGDLPLIQYEDHQPPLYYLLASLVFRVTEGSLIALRLFSVLLGAGVVLGAYAASKALLPDSPQIALGTAALVAFVPQHVAMLAAVNNDGLAELLVAVTLWLTIVYLKAGRVRAWQLGILVGLGLLTKVSTIFLAGLVPLAILIKWWIERRDARAHRRAPLQDLVAFAILALVLGGVWWARNISVYGFPDLFGLARHNLVVADQPRTADLIAQVGAGEYLRRVVNDTFNSFWGQFGWMALPLQTWMYALLLALLVVAATGWIVGFRAHSRVPLRATADLRQRAAWGIVILAGLLAVAQYVYYNLEFLQLQGRYMYPGLIPLGLGVALGVDGWRRAIIADNGGRTAMRPYISVLVIAGVLVALDVYIAWRVLPGLAP